MGIKRGNENSSKDSKKVCCDNKDNDIKMEEAESQPQNEPLTNSDCCKKQGGGCCKKQGGGCTGKQGSGCGGCCKRRAAMMAADAASGSAENQSEVKSSGQSSPCGGCPKKQGCGGCCKRRAAMMAADTASDSAENQSNVKSSGQSSPCGRCPKKQGCGGCCKRRAAMMAADTASDSAENQSNVKSSGQSSPCGGCPKKQGCGGCPGKQGGGCGGCCKRRAAMMAADATSGSTENQSEVKSSDQSSPCGGCPKKQACGGCPGKQGGGCGGCCKRRAAMMAADATSGSTENQSEVKSSGQSSPCGGCPKKKVCGGCPGKQGGGCGGCCKRRAAMMATAAASGSTENQSEVKLESQSTPCNGCPGRQRGGCCKRQSGCGGCSGKQNGGCCRNQGGSPCANCPGKQSGCCRNQGGSPCANCPNRQGGCCGNQGGLSCANCPNRNQCANCPNRNICPSANANAGCPGMDSENRGMASACEGCPNRAFCMSNKIVVDPDLDIIKKKMETIKHKVLILSGKGGVGKSTLSSQLAYTIGRDEDIQIGLCDVDITGPSQPIIMGAENEPVHQSNTGITPVYVQDNLAVMSIGFLLEKQDESVIWRGPKKNGLIKHFLKDVEWGDLDLLLFDTPPGTSDEHLSIVQYLKGCDIDGAILISTPQEISIQDVRKEINFCKKVDMPILGIVENMSGFVCPSCKGESVIFPATNGGVKALCEEINIPFLGAIPLDPRIVNSCDAGEPFVDSYPDSPASERYIEISKKIKEMLDF